uniref:Spaetzle domain-containing protein n=1 Tax=Trichuris muris TaxID=70415 RepID=A0A5S6QU21_TRIMR
MVYCIGLLVCILSVLGVHYEGIRRANAQNYHEYRAPGLDRQLRAVELMPEMQSVHRKDSGHDADTSTYEPPETSPHRSKKHWKIPASFAGSADSTAYEHERRGKQFLKHDTDTASSVIELILNFRDPITDYPIVPDFSLSRYGGEAKVSCSTRQCLGCMQKLFDKLKYSYANSKQDKIHTEMRFLSQQLHLDYADYRGYCKHFDAKSSDFFDCQPSFVSEEDVQKMNDYLKGNMLTCPAHHGKIRRKTVHGKLPDVDYNRNWLRKSYSDSAPNGKTVQGRSAQISCNYRRGEPQEQPGSDTGLCDMCWSLMTLPDSFSPRFINQLMCNPTDSSCLSGYGTCRARYRHITVWYNNRTTDMQNAVVYVPVACECQVPYSSVLRNLVIGTQSNGA